MHILHRERAQLPHDPSRIGRMRQRLGLPRIPHADHLSRTWAAYSACGRGCPGSK